MRLRVFLFLCLLLTSCMPHKPQYMSPDFTHAKMWEGKIAFGGISSTVDKWDMDKMLAMARLASGELDSKEFYVRLVPFDRYLQAVGEDGYESYNQIFRETGTLENESITELSNSLKGIRYIFFSRVVSDELEKDSENKVEYEEDKKKLEFHYYYSVSRTIVAHTVIYDLQTKQLVWEDNHSHIGLDSNSCEEYEGSYDCAWLTGMPESERYPDPPADSGILSVIFGVSVMGLPRPCDARNGGLECAKLQMKLRREWEEKG